jgi:hypothetical protein
VAARFVSPELKIRFTGGREMSDWRCAPSMPRYGWVKKRFEGTGKWWPVPRLG